MAPATNPIYVRHRGSSLVAKTAMAPRSPNFRYEAKIGFSKEGKRFMRRSKRGEPPALPTIYVMEVPASPAKVLVVTRTGNEIPCSAARKPEHGRMISLDTGKQPYSKKIKRRMAARPYLPNREYNCSIYNTSHHRKTLIYPMLEGGEVFLTKTL